MSVETTNAPRAILPATAAAVAGWLRAQAEAAARRRACRRVFAELSALSDRELADLDLPRHALRDIARQAAGL